MRFNKLLKLIVSSAFLCALGVKAEGDCKALKDIAHSCEEDSEGKVKYIGMYHDKDIDDKGWEKLFSYKTVKELHLSGIDTKGFDQNIIDKIGSLKNLEKLDIGSLSTYKDGINYDSFKNLSKLTELEIYGSDDKRVLQKNVINKFKNLKLLDLREAKLSQADIDEIKSLTEIDKLHISNISFEDNLKYDFKNVNELEIAYAELRKNFFASFKNLKKLTMEENIDIQQYHIDEISTLSSLEELIYDINSASSDDVDFSPLKNLKNIKRCYIKRGYNENLNLESLKDVKHLQLEIVVTSQSDVDKLAALPHLEYAHLVIIKDEDNLDLSSLKKNKNITGITIEGSNDKHDHEKTLKKNLLKGFSNIKSLTIERIDLNQSDIDDIATLTQLEELKFHLADFDDINIEPLNKLSNLKSIEIDMPAKGKTLTISSLEKCIYNENSELCIAKDMKCLSDELKSKFKPCSSGSSDGKTSTNGKCGKQYGKCPSGQCCSEYGYCGKTEDYCGTGCQSEFGDCKSTTTTSKDGKCGKDKGKCPAGQCCSKYGYCGKTDDYCGTGCQSEFGDCKSTTTTTTTTISKDGKCGKDKGKCPTGECCSKHGYCGKTEKYCGAGCQSEFGECNSTKVSKDGKCGKDKGVCPAGECCSKHGYCGKTEKYCGAGCQSEFGDCQTTKVSKDGKCGKDKGVCPSGQCCSKYGYCGKTEKYCGGGCQSEFGKCN